jgi:hypothetical protein
MLQLVIGPQLEPDKDSQSLFKKSSLDGMTQSVIQNFLEKGNFFNPSETLAKKSESCPPNNISVERVCVEMPVPNQGHCGFDSFPVVD